VPYTHTTWGTLKTQLANRLGDSASTFWTNTVALPELEVLLTESLHTFSLLSGFWRERAASLTLTAATAFFDLTTALNAGLVDSTVTDQDIIQQIQFQFLEDASVQTSWPGTDQFTYSDVTNAITRRRNQFLSDTGIILTRSTPAITVTGRQTLVDTIIDIRRAAYRSAVPFQYYSQLSREDERVMTLANPDWSANQGTPRSYSVMAPPPLVMQLDPPPVAGGTLDLITVSTGPTLDPAVSATALGIPDDLTPAIKWGAMSDLLGIDGQARDTQRAQFCEQRYQQFVELARMLSMVVNTELGGLPTIPETLYDLDSAIPHWQDYSGTPTVLALGGWNMMAVSPVPDTQGPYSAILDVVRKADIPTKDVNNVQIGREQLDMILDYAEHLALFKVGGAEWQATTQQANNFLLQSITYNQRLGAAAPYVIIPKDASQREKDYRPRREQADGLGAMPSVTEPQAFVKTNAPVRLNR
jgi:hypothetical protein